MVVCPGPGLNPPLPLLTLGSVPVASSDAAGTIGAMPLRTMAVDAVQDLQVMRGGLMQGSVLQPSS